MKAKECQHVPVRQWYPGGKTDVCCQECGKQMTEREWVIYFRNRPDVLSYTPKTNDVELPAERLSILDE
jgi:hypothetical protein